MVLSIFSALVEEEFANSANSLTSFEFFSGSDLALEKTKSFYAIGRRISADSRISHQIVDPLSERWIRICYYLKIIGYQNRISDIRQSFVST